MRDVGFSPYAWVLPPGLDEGTRGLGWRVPSSLAVRFALERR